MKRLFLFLPVLLLAVQSGRSFAQGAGTALSFSGQSLQSASVTHNIGTGNFTWEAWIKPSVAANNTSGTGTGFMANGNYSPALYASTGGTAPANGFGTLGIYWSGIGGTSWKNSGVKLAANKWYHVAIVRNGTTLSFYVNGMLAPNTYTINATAAMANAPMRLGYSGDGSESFQGNLDEVRVWAVARTETELRANMCQKLNGNETGLKVYYRLDEATGTTLSNAVTSGGGTITFPATNTPAWVSSGAPLGDTALSLYTTNYGTQTLSLSSIANGNITLSNISNTSPGVQVYRVDNTPNTTTGIPNAGTNNVYYGIFTADTALNTTGSSYDVQYAYSGFPAAVSFASGINLYTRQAADAPWGLSTATNTQATHVFQLGNTPGRKEMIIGNFVTTVVCTQPTALNVQNITATAATLGWITGGSNTWNLSWGAGTTFLPAAGTIVNGLTTASYSLTNLSAATTYSFYVRDTCTTAGSASPWAGPFTFTTGPDLSMGAGTGIYFNGSESILSTAAVNHGIDTGDFTWEAWINPAKITGSTCIMTNGNYVPALYATTAGSGGNGSVGFYWGGWKNSNTFIEKDKWSHVAMVRSQDTITIYVNGIVAPNRFAMGNTMANNKLRLGWSGDISEYFQGVLDEVRVWKVARTEAQLRENMCRKLQGNETGLVNYLPLNEGYANVAADIAGTALFNTVNPARWRISGAAIGDTSIYIYPQVWNGTALSLGSNAIGTFTVDSVAANVKGMHVYRVNSRPNYNAGIQDAGNTDQYFGVFAVGDYNAADYKIRYDYTGYPAAVANNSGLHVYNRKDNAATPWTQTPAINNTTNHTIQRKQALGTRQYLLADFSTVSCLAPAMVSVDNVDTGNAQVSWTSSAAAHVLEYGNANFTLGTGTAANTNMSNLQLTGLLPAYTYEFYLKDSCAATNNSAWVGPFLFTTLDPCPVPSSVYADSITSSRIIVKWDDNGLVTQDYTISWGLQGFGDPNIGILSTATEKRFDLSGMTLNTAYDFYIRANCNSSVAHSAWAGPFSFSTVACDVPYNLVAQNVTANGASISWITGGAALHNLEYGVAGFTHGNGTVQSNISAPNYTIVGLQANTAYDVYVQDSCSAVLGSSAWAGPLTFTTKQVTGIDAVEQVSNTLQLFPNPAQDRITIKMLQGKMSMISLTGSTGQVVREVKGAGKHEITCTLNGLPSGIYFIEVVTTDGNRLVRKMMVKH